MKSMKIIKLVLSWMLVGGVSIQLISCSTGLKDSEQDVPFVNPYEEAAGRCMIHDFEDDVCAICNTPYMYSEGLQYELSSDETAYLVTGIGDCKDMQILIPSEYNGLPVTGISEGAFTQKKITAVFLPNSITSIGAWAFGGCTKLLYVDIPSTVTDIGIEAFEGCFRLASVKIPKNITTLSAGVFENCSSLTDITLPNSLETIGKSAFANCSGIQRLVIPGSVIEIDSGAFDNCIGLKKIEFRQEALPKMNTPFEGCTELEAIYYPGTLTTWCRTDFDTNPLRQGKHLYVDGELIKGQFQTPKGLKRIGKRVMEGNADITGVVISKEVEKIGSWAFARCENLTYVVLEGSPTAIADNSFSESGLQQIFLRDTKEEAQLYIAYLLGIAYHQNVEIFYSGEWYYNQDGVPCYNS